VHVNTLKMKMQTRKYVLTTVWGAGILAVTLLLSGATPRPAGEAVSWMTVDQAADKLQHEQRPVLIDLYTTWCGWCREMDKKTYSSKKVAAYLGEKFYTVKVDAETHAAITWQGHTYSYNPQYRSNEFALYLTHGRLEFPTTIIIPPGDVPQAIPGFLEPKDLELLVKYFGEGAYKTQGFDAYQKSFKASW
jgi:thioredoxin-related protein